jgi:hypothetical protein
MFDPEFNRDGCGLFNGFMGLLAAAGFAAGIFCEVGLRAPLPDTEVVAADLARPGAFSMLEDGLSKAGFCSGRGGDRRLATASAI